MIEHAFVAVMFMLGLWAGLATARWIHWRDRARYWQNVARHYHGKWEELEREKWADTAPPTAKILPFERPE